MSDESGPRLSNRDFVIEEFKALRAEILAKVERSIRLQLIGVTAIPLVIGTSKSFELHFAVAASPVVTTLFILLLLYENIGIMRAGKYIRTRVEPALGNGSEVPGRESWLENDRLNRKPERVFAWASYIAFCLYYIGGAYIAYKPLKELFAAPVAGAVMIGYFVLLFLLLGIVITELPTTTEPKDRRWWRLRLKWENR